MIVLITIALKSLLIAGLTLGLLQLMKARSAAERSWVAHTGLLALLIMAFAPLVVPKLAIEAPFLFHQAAAPEVFDSGARSLTHVVNPRPSRSDIAVVPSQTRSTMPSLDAAAAVTAIYAVPAAVLLFLTLIALLRLFALRARADVLVDGHWLSALARAQRRMGFKHGTALLTSNELTSPISWGLMRPVILLNNRAVEAAGEAEAIIAHELAHVARMDWMKLLLARFATALFWFNPFVWLLAREAHQLREEAADDSVLDADIVDTDYAQLLVGVARHECPGLLLGAHGVAPSKNSLTRRVARVLDGKSVRGPVARSFAVCVIAGAVLIAAPLAALTLQPASPLQPDSLSKSAMVAPSLVSPTDTPADLPHLIATGVSTSVNTASAAINQQVESPQTPANPVFAPIAVAASANGTIARTSNGAMAMVNAPDANGRPRAVAISPSGATAASYADANHGVDGNRTAARHSTRDNLIDTAIEMKAVGVTPEFASAMRAASPSLRSATLNEIVALKAVGVTPDYVREIAKAGFSNLGASQIEEARAVGVNPDYMRAMHSTGVPITFEDLVELRAMGVRPDELSRVRQAGFLRTEKLHVIHGAHRLRPPQPPSSDDPDDG